MADWGFSKHKNTIENWPKDEKGELVPPVFLQHVRGTQLDFDMAINLLEAYSIPVVCQYPNDGEFGKLILGIAGGGMDILVTQTLLEDAQNIISCDIEHDTEEK